MVASFTSSFAPVSPVPALTPQLCQPLGRPAPLGASSPVLSLSRVFVHLSSGSGDGFRLASSRTSSSLRSTSPPAASPHTPGLGKTKSDDTTMKMDPNQILPKHPYALTTSPDTARASADKSSITTSNDPPLRLRSNSTCRELVPLTNSPVANSFSSSGATVVPLPRCSELRCVSPPAPWSVSAAGSPPQLLASSQKNGH